MRTVGFWLLGQTVIVAWGIGIAAIVVAVANCGQLTPETQQHIAQCAIAYQRCVASSQTRPEYEACRAGVDAQCVDGGGCPTERAPTSER